LLIPVHSAVPTPIGRPVIERGTVPA
jgi:hypothetical protein